MVCTGVITSGRSGLECHSYQLCSKIVQTHSTSLTSGNNCDAVKFAVSYTFKGRSRCRSRSSFLNSLIKRLTGTSNQNQCNHWPTRTDANNAINQSELETNPCNRRQARENACTQVTIGFGFTSDWFRNWREVFFLSQSHNVVQQIQSNTFQP